MSPTLNLCLNCCGVYGCVRGANEAFTAGSSYPSDAFLETFPRHLERCTQITPRITCSTLRRSVADVDARLYVHSPDEPKCCLELSKLRSPHVRAVRCWSQVCACFERFSKILDCLMAFSVGRGCSRRMLKQQNRISRCLAYTSTSQLRLHAVWTGTSEAA